jgi:hypothetical protein
MSEAYSHDRPDTSEIPPSNLIPRTVRELRMSRSRQQERV